jgi:hypothetical protein
VPEVDFAEWQQVGFAEGVLQQFVDVGSAAALATPALSADRQPQSAIQAACSGIATAVSQMSNFVVTDLPRNMSD